MLIMREIIASINARINKIYQNKSATFARMLSKYLISNVLKDETKN